MSLFGTAVFDWQFSNPTMEVQDGAVHLSGPIVVYSNAALDALFALVRPVSVRVAGDPTGGGTTYVDHWGPDPSLLLKWQGKQATAILSTLSRGQAMPGDAHLCTATFVLLTAITPITP